MTSSAPQSVSPKPYIRPLYREIQFPKTSLHPTRSAPIIHSNTPSPAPQPLFTFLPLPHPLYVLKPVQVVSKMTSSSPPSAPPPPSSAKRLFRSSNQKLCAL